MPNTVSNAAATAGESSPPAAASASGKTADNVASRDSWNSMELLGDRLEVLIVHGDEVYRLRRTRQDKLILYK
jgi:hemin uptake protein HemP